MSEKNEFKWSIKLQLVLSSLAGIVMFGSYYTSVMADKAQDAGKMEEATLLALMSMISLPAALLVAAVAAWKLLFTVPSPKAPNWMKRINYSKLAYKE